MALYPDWQNVSEIRSQVKKDFKRIKKTEENRYRKDDAPDGFKKGMCKSYKSKYSGRMI